MSKMNKNKREDRWVNLLKETVKKNHPELPSDAWENLNFKLTQEEKKNAFAARKKKTVLTISSIAAILLFLLLFKNTSVLEQKTVPIIKEKEIIATIEPYTTQLKDNSGTQSNSVSKLHKTAYKSIRQESKKNKSHAAFSKEEKQDTKKTVVTKDASPQKETSKEIEEKGKRKRYKKASYYTPRNHSYSKNKSSTKKWSLALAASPQTSQFSAQNNLHASSLLADDRMTLSIPRGNEFYIQENVPLPQNQPQKIEHSQPIQLGVYFSYTLVPKWALETGLFYTKLNSTFSFMDLESRRQTLQYLGIPLTLQWYIWKQNHLSYYLGAGGAVEFAISSKYNNETIKNSRPQWSVNSHIGLEYQFIKSLSLFAEIGAAYYFDNGSLLKTIRTEHPLGLNISFGLKFSY